MNERTLTDEQQTELKRLKQYFPFRIAYAAVKDDEFLSGAVPTMRVPNDLARRGYAVWTAR